MIDIDTLPTVPASSIQVREVEKFRTDPSRFKSRRPILSLLDETERALGIYEALRSKHGNDSIEAALYARKLPAMIEAIRRSKVDHSKHVRVSAEIAKTLVEASDV